MSDHCLGCGTAVVSTGAPLWEYYCPNKTCSYDIDRDEAVIRANVAKTRSPSVPVGTRLAMLKGHRDALNAEIKLMEEGIRKAEYDANFVHQLWRVNDARQREGKRPLTMTEFMAAIPVEDDL